MQTARVYTYQVPEELKTRMPGYLERRFQDLEEIEKYISLENWGGVGTVAHKIKGNGAAFGFQELTDLSANIEDALETGDPSEVRKAVVNLKKELHNIKLFLEATLE